MLEVPEKPFSSSDLIVIFTVLLDFYVSEVGFEVAYIIRRIRLVSEPCKSTTIQPGC